jgi:cytochrome c-type biogenesis protein CcmF
MAAFAARHLTPAQAQQALAPLWQERDQAISGLTARFVSHPWPVNFLLIVDPMVTWIWLGAIIIAIGGLIALSPVPAFTRRRPVSSHPAPSAPPERTRELV